MSYTITGSCLKCGICIEGCPEGAIIAGERIVEPDGLVLQAVSITPEKCTDCAICVSEEWWCPAQAIIKV